MHGLLIVDKPSGVTSRDEVNRIQRLLPRKTKIGHAGTLDPLATGVLVLAVGHATRLIEYVQDLPKVYHTCIRLGARSTTDDADGEITPTPNAVPVSREAIERALVLHVGTIQQVPPAFSAAHVDGQRAYNLARRGENVALDARTVRIDRIEIREYVWPELVIDVYCGKGTYIRSIARDLGDALGVGGYVTVLRRQAIGTFTTAQALPESANRDTLPQYLLPLTAAVAHLPKHTVEDADITRIRYGQFVTLTAPNGELAILDPAGQLVATGHIENNVFKPDKVLPV